MNPKRLSLLIAGAFVAFTLGYGAVAHAWPTPYKKGYFLGHYNSGGGDVFQPDSDTPGCAASGGYAVPGASINTAAKFVSFFKCKLTSTNSYGPYKTLERTGAAFVMQTMIGNTGSKITSTGDPRVGTWASYVTNYFNSGWVHFYTAGYSYNSYYQGTYNSKYPSQPLYNDDAFFGDNNSAFSVVFHKPGTSQYYIIRLQCGNPTGIAALYPPTPPPSFNLAPAISVTVDGSASPGNIAEAGQTIKFTYNVTNNGGASSGTNCSLYGFTRTGYYALPATPDGSSDPGYVSPPLGCPRNFVTGMTTLNYEQLSGPSVPGNRSICRSLFVDPATPGGGSKGTEVCVYVMTKPYERVYGGDVAAGGGFAASTQSANTCAYNAGAAIIGWNKRSGGGYGGAGVQFAEYALNKIFDTASALGGGVAAAPVGLSFANTATNSSAGLFGGGWGSAPCIPDYYDTIPSSPQLIPGTYISSGAVSTAQGAYKAVGNVTVEGGTINPNQKVDLYVKGNLYIAGDVKYGGTNWNPGNVPVLRVIVDGNIYIGSGVHQLDGLYVAQPKTDPNTGVLFTCTSSSNPFAQVSLSGSLSSLCDQKLTVNGSFVARQVRLLRTLGTLRQSNAGEGSGSNNIAEVFNYNPVMWMAQPVDPLPRAEYDAISSLPPIL